VRIGGDAAGWLGELHPRLVRHFELPSPPIVFELDLAALAQQPVARAQPVSKLPVVRRDLAIVVDEAIPAQEVVDALIAVKPPFVDRLGIFDVYRGPGIESGKKSLAILVLIQDTARTLTDAEIDAAVAVLLRELQSRFKAVLRR
jgi:phenylalanyl-tRNA synthetase beta chain